MAGHGTPEPLDDAELFRALTTGGREDPFALYARHTGPGSRFAAADAILRDPRFRAAPPSRNEGPAFELLGRWLISIEGPRHRAIRRVAQRAFDRRSAASLEAEIRSRVDGALDAVAEAGAMDVVAAYARPVALGTVMSVLGVPPEQHAGLDAMLSDLARGFANQHDPGLLARGHAAATSLQEHFTDLLAARRAHPADDLLTAIVQDEEIAQLADDDVVANAIFLIQAGHQTTAHLISGGTLALLSDTGAMDLIRGEPSMIDDVVEELLRFLSPLAVADRTPTEAVNIDGQMLPPGVAVTVFLGAANRDPAAFTDPHRFDVHRRDVRHLAFGAGPHFCLGAPLARLEATIALAALAARFPDLRLGEDPPVWRSAVPLRGLERLEVRW